MMVTLFNYIEKIKNHKNNFKPDYYIPRFIADCAKDAGFSGIKYLSALSHNSFNVVLFEKHEELLPIGEPKYHKVEPLSDY